MYYTYIYIYIYIRVHIYIYIYVYIYIYIYIYRSTTGRRHTDAGVADPGFRHEFFNVTIFEFEFCYNLSMLQFFNVTIFQCSSFVTGALNFCMFFSIVAHAQGAVLAMSLYSDVRQETRVPESQVSKSIRKSDEERQAWTMSSFCARHVLPDRRPRTCHYYCYYY